MTIREHLFKPDVYCYVMGASGLIYRGEIDMKKRKFIVLLTSIWSLLSILGILHKFFREPLGFALDFVILIPCVTYLLSTTPSNSNKSKKEENTDRKW